MTPHPHAGDGLANLSKVLTKAGRSRRPGRAFAITPWSAVWFSPSAPRGADDPGRLAQRESASFTPKRSLVRSQYRPPASQQVRARMATQPPGSFFDRALLVRYRVRPTPHAPPRERSERGERIPVWSDDPRARAGPAPRTATPRPAPATRPRCAASRAASAEGSCGSGRRRSRPRTSPQADVAGLLGIDPLRPVVVRRHLLTLDGHPAATAELYFRPEQVTGSRIPLQEEIPGSVHAELARTLGAPLTRAGEALVARMPTLGESELLNLPTGTPVVALTRTIYAGEQAVEVTVWLFDASRHRFIYDVPMD